MKQEEAKRQDEANRKMGQVIAKAWADDAFKAKLLADPAETLKAEGVEVPAGVKINAVENTGELFYLVIPAKPAELSEAELSGVAGGRWETCEPIGIHEWWGNLPEPIWVE